MRDLWSTGNLACGESQGTESRGVTEREETEGERGRQRGREGDRANEREERESE